MTAGQKNLAFLEGPPLSAAPGAASESDPRPGWTNLAQMLRGTAHMAAGAGVYIVDARGGQEFREYPQILENAMRAGAALQARGVGPGDRVMLVQSTGFEFLSAFFGAQIIGALPVPIVPPRAGSAQERRDRLRFGHRSAPAFSRYARQLGVAGIVADRGVDLSGASAVQERRKPIFMSSLGELLADTSAQAEPEPVATPHDLRSVAYLQLSAGTAGRMRAVELTGQNILSNARAIGHALQVVPGDVGVSWVPPYNSMGLVGVICFGIYWGLDMVMIHPERFLQRPEEWLMAISRHRGTLSTAPNFGYHYALRRCQESNLRGLDLSSWRVAMNGGEPVRAQHMDAFERRFSQYGLKRDLFLPVYGLAEATLGVTFGPLGAPVKLDGINRRVLETRGEARPLPQTGANSPPERLHLVSVGRPLEGVSVKIMDSAVKPPRQLGERVCGEVWVKGPGRLYDYAKPHDQSAGAHPRAPQDSRLAGEWLATGDLGYIADGELYVIGRACDMIKTARGRMLFPDEIELYVDSVDGVRVGSSVAFSVPADLSTGGPARERSTKESPTTVDAARINSANLNSAKEKSAKNARQNHNLQGLDEFSAPEERSSPEDSAAASSPRDFSSAEGDCCANLLVIVYELQDGTAPAEVEQAVRELLRKHMSIDPHTLLALSQDSVPKTHSGKVRRSLTRALYLKGRLERRRRADEIDPNASVLERAQRQVSLVGQRVLSQFQKWWPRAEDSE